MAEKQYNETEVLALLRRAADYEAGAAATVDGLNEDQVRAMALELGISPEAFDMALRAGEEPVLSRFERFIDAPIVHEVDCTFAGRVTAEGWAECVHALRGSLGVNGAISTVGNAYEWSAGDKELIPTVFSAVSKNGKTRLRARSDVSPAVFLFTLVGAMATLIVSVMLLAGAYAALPIKAFVVALLVASVVYIYRLALNGIGSRRRRAMDSLTVKLRATLSAEEEGAPDLAKSGVVKEPVEAEQMTQA